MSKVIEPPQQRGSSQEIRSQIALEILLNAYAVVGAAVILRCILLGLGVTERLWLGEVTYRWTDLLVMPLNVLPGASYEVYRSLAVADLTLLAGVILVPLGLYSRSGRHK
jgi:hypothetical protein